MSQAAPDPLITASVIIRSNGTTPTKNTDNTENNYIKYTPRSQPESVVGSGWLVVVERLAGTE